MATRGSKYGVCAVVFLMLCGLPAVASVAIWNSGWSGGSGGAVTVAGGATLGGSGTINRAVMISDNAILAPGSSPGTLTIVGPLALNPLSRAELERLDRHGHGRPFCRSG